MMRKYFNQDTSLPTADKNTLYWQGLVGAAIPLAIADALETHDGPVVILCKDNFSCQTLMRELKFFYDSPETVYSFPDWETLPYDSFSPHQDIVSERLLALEQLDTRKSSVLVLPVTALANRLCPPSFLQQLSFNLEVGQQLSIDNFRKRLVNSGYQSVSEVMQHGEFTIRGSLIDLYPMGSNTPFRIDLFDDEIDSIRLFDPETQRSKDKVTSIKLMPAHEFPINEEGITTFRKKWREYFAGDPLKCPMYEDISQGITPHGSEYYLPLFFDETASLFDFCHDTTLFITVDDIHTPMQNYWNEIKSRHEQLQYDITKPILPPSDAFFTTESIFERLKQFHEISILNKEKTRNTAINFDSTLPGDFNIESKSGAPLSRLKQHLEATDERVLLCAETEGRREAILELCQKTDLKPSRFASWAEFCDSDTRLGLIVANLDNSVVLPFMNVSIIAEQSLYGQRVMQRRRRKERYGDGQNDQVIRNLAELNIGNPVVHIEHGIGRYMGLKTITVGEIQSEFLHLAYAENSNLYVPVSSLHLISRYAGAEESNAPLNRLGTNHWEKARKKAAEQIRDVAAELLQIYAKRQARKGEALPVEEEHYLSFSESFPFEETPDQEKAILDVKSDLHNDKAMDRLVCGDVGFGKTEVAMRAAFIAVNAGKQVAILVPTTLLAQQHFDSFKDRFANWPVQIELLSRFRTQKTQKEVIERAQEGKVDIVIGTHKLLGKEIIFKNLGLLIIDEEHRFGVRQKEKLKSLRAEVDLLTLTATPIPRTLNMALGGLRDLSIIATPPQKRLSIKTFVRESNPYLVKEAILREIMRGGQVYYLHNDVKTIARIAEELQTLVPDARIGIGHGQMPERQLEQVMADFYHQRFNVLVCTTIIETGIDIPTANTIIIDRADKFGLAQLHQLRGRVGRSHHQAYAYLLTPNPKAMTADATKRLEAIGKLEDLGAGFSLASHDLEIRGAGELLGEEQSGNIQTIGFSLYMEMLDRAVKALQDGETLDDIDPTSQIITEVDLKIPALIPNDYLPDVHSRLVLYKRIANADNSDTLSELKVEMIDRFGSIPTQAQHLFVMAEFKLIAKKLGIKKIDATPSGITLEFFDKTNIDPGKIIQLIQTKPSIYQLEGPKRLRYKQPLTEASARVDAVKTLLATLGTTGH